MFPFKRGGKTIATTALFFNLRRRKLRDPARSGASVRLLFRHEVIEYRRWSVIGLVVVAPSLQKYPAENPAFLWRGGTGLGRREAVFMHDPISSAALWRLTGVEDEGFLHPDDLVGPRAHDLLVQTGCFPVPGDGGPVRPVSVGILGFFGAEEIPLLLRIACDHTPLPLI